MVCTILPRAKARHALKLQAKKAIEKDIRRTKKKKKKQGSEKMIQAFYLIAWLCDAYCIAFKFIYSRSLRSNKIPDSCHQLIARYTIRVAKASV